MATIVKMKSRIQKSLQSDIAAYFELKSQREDMKAVIINQMERNDLRKVETSDFVASLTEVQRKEIDAEDFYNNLSKKERKAFFQMISVVKTKAKKFVGDDLIEKHSFLTSTYDRFDVKRKKKIIKRKK